MPEFGAASQLTLEGDVADTRVVRVRDGATSASTRLPTPVMSALLGVRDDAAVPTGSVI
jgi:hypothetical protein